MKYGASDTSPAGWVPEGFELFSLHGDMCCTSSMHLEDKIE